MQSVRRGICGLFLISIAALVGCDGIRTADVKGAVKYDGELIDDGTIAFYPADGKGPSAGGTIKGGQYSARVPVGTMKVTISWPKGTGVKKKLYEHDPNSAVIEFKSECLPDRYVNQEATELACEVKSGSNQKDWDLVK